MNDFLLIFSSLYQIFLQLFVAFILDLHIIQIFIIPGPDRKLFPPQLFVNNISYQPVNNRKGRNPDNHSRKSQEAAKEQNGKQHPEAGNPGGVPQYLWSQNVTVKLLQQQNKNQKVQALNRAYQKNDW